MSFRSITMRQEELPWSWPLRLGANVPAQRARSVITAVDDQGQVHQAELAPCPGVHPETLDQASEQWHQLIESLILRRPLRHEQWSWIRPAFGLIDLSPSLYRSVLTAVEQLLLSWAQSQTPEEISLPAPMSIEGSALLTLDANQEVFWQEFLQLWDQGFRLFKCKIGRLSAAHEYDMLRAMFEHGAGQLRLRLDANRGMSVDALNFWKEKASLLPIEYWEEAAGMEPAALDETLWDDADSIPKAAAWILKPARLGLSRTIELLKRAAQDQRPCVLSNTFDSGLSLRCGAWIYAAFCANPRPLGYGTTRFLPPDAWDSISWGRARVTVPLHPFSQRDEA